MRQINFPSFSPLQHLAADEWLLAAAERNELPVGAFRAWEVDKPCIVLGRGSKVTEEVDQEACAADGISILRRTSGGATILTGPGCLMYTVVLRHEDDARLVTIDATHGFILGTMAESLNIAIATLENQSPGVGSSRVEKAGTSDLAMRTSIGGAPPMLKKVSGNAMRRGRNHTLYHGTLLYDFDLSLISRYLRTAPRQPEYRAARDHHDFVTNLPLSRDAIVAAVESAWQTEPSEPAPAEWLEEIDSLVTTKYALESWNLRH